MLRLEAHPRWQHLWAQTALRDVRSLISLEHTGIDPRPAAAAHSACLGGSGSSSPLLALLVARCVAARAPLSHHHLLLLLLPLTAGRAK